MIFAERPGRSITTPIPQYQLFRQVKVAGGERVCFPCFQQPLAVPDLESHYH